ncbi:alpha/beta hydrolase [Dickeya chrysanthemi]|uniref:alpha/beta hydrolase n=1 Tax=Dickeya chrysanthemi TaxID=556 RepID=UPI0003A6B110|nr:alpha/beta fold hydrolase [Dickeya chrysanthemi]MBX9447453.1 alpha/beta fold hydrolase [Dickeya chrysanthemi]
MKTYLENDQLNEKYPAQTFALRSQDGNAILTGQINYPQAPTGRYPLIMLVPGSGMHNRHYLIGDSGSQADFVFTCLAQDFLAAGLAVLRFDGRGVKGHLRDKALDNPEYLFNRELAYQRLLIDAAVRQTVTPQSQCDDLYTLCRYALDLPHIDRHNLILLGHSEGAINLSRLVARYPIAAKALMLVSPTFSSMKQLMEWQLIHRTVTWLKAIPHTGDRLTLEALKNGFGHSPLAFLQPISSLLPYKGYWDEADFDSMTTRLQASFEQQRDITLRHEDQEPWPADAPFTQSSYAWWKQWYQSETPEIEHLVQCQSRIICYFGMMDTQVNAAAEAALFERVKHRFPHVDITLLPDVGHTLGIHGLLGPMTESCAALLVQTAHDIVTTG